jgi:hypothetical protein
MLHNLRSTRVSAAVRALGLLIVVSFCLLKPSVVSAQNATSTEDRVKVLERERDELKKRNGVLELRLKQLQATVNKQVTDALGPALAGPGGEPPPVPHPPGEPPVTVTPVPPSISSYQMAYWRGLGPPGSRLAGIFSPLQQPVDLVTLGVAYQDALRELQRARQDKDPKAKQPSVELDSAERKVGLLRSITKTIRDQLADEVDRMHRLEAIHAVPAMDVRNLDTKLRILDLILAQDPDAGPVSNEPKKPAAPPKAN